MSKIIGLKSMSFTTKDGTHIEGTKIFTSDPIKNGKGVEPESVFLTRDKMAALDFVPDVGMDIEILYNRWGKVKTIKTNSDDDFIEIE